MSKTLDGVITSWNPAAEQLFGFTADEAIGSSIEIIVPAERRAEVRTILECVRRGEKISHHETVRITKDGRRIDVAVSISPINSPEGAVIGATKVARDITESKKRHEALQREIGELRRIFETSQDVILVTDHEGNFVQVSPSCAPMLGYLPEEMVGRNGIEFVHPDDLENTRAEMRLARRGGLIRKFATRYIRKDGSVVALEWNGVWSQPEQRHFFIGRDMTAQLLAEEKFHLAVEASPSGIAMVDRDGRLVLVNTETERLFGYRREELIGQSIDILVPAELRGRHSGHRSNFLLKPTARRMGADRELRGRRKDGTEFPIEVGLNPIQSRDGLLVMSVILDISERRKAQEALRESERLARSIIDTALDAIIQINDAGEVIEWNPQAEAIFGWSRQEAVGKSITELYLPKGYLPRFLAINARLGEQHQILQERFEFEALRKDGQKIKVEMSLVGMRRREGTMYNGFVRDITAKSAAEEQLRQSQKMEAVGQLTGGIAHDFNNILTVITGTTEILGEIAADRPEVAELAKEIDDAAQRGAALTGGLLAFARKQPLQPRKTDVNGLIVDAAKLLRQTLGEHIEIESTLEDVGPSLVDPHQLTTALINLALNARDAMPDGGKLMLETATAHLDEQYAVANPEIQPGSYVMVAVSDTGGGIPAEIRDKVFEPFFTTKPVGKGTGLGLSMVYGFIKQSGGHVKIYSEEGVGTTIKLYLPTVLKLDASADSELPAAIEGGQERILVVEDDPLVRRFVTRQLKSLGYTSLVASNAAEALTLIEKGVAFDLLFTDVIMPGAMNGRELADEAVKRRPSTRVLFTSGYTESAMLLQGRLDPDVSLLTKPYRKTDLARMIRTVMSKPAARSLAHPPEPADGC